MLAKKVWSLEIKDRKAELRRMWLGSYLANWASFSVQSSLERTVLDDVPYEKLNGGASNVNSKDQENNSDFGNG